MKQKPALSPRMLTTVVFASIPAAILLGPSSAIGQPSGGSTDKTAELLRKAQAACESGTFGRGVDLTYKAATAAHGAPAGDPVKRKWRSVLRKCYNAWIAHLAKECKPETLNQMNQLEHIARQARKVAEAAVARKAEATRRACFLSIGAKLKQHCSRDPGARSVELARKLVKQTAAMGTTIPKNTTARIAAALPFCLKQWLNSATTRCQAMPNVPVLRELGSLVAASTPESRPAVKQAYEACAKQMGNYAWQLCQRREYRKGRAILKEAIGRYTFFSPQDLAFLKQMKTEFLPRCGTFRASMTAKVNALTAGVTLNVVARVEIVLARTTIPDRYVGILRVRPKFINASSPAGQVLVSELKGSQVFLKAKLNRKSGNVAWWPSGPPTPGVESIQINRRGQAALVFRDSIVDELLGKTGVFKSWISTRTGGARRFRFNGSMGGGRRGKVTGTLTMSRLK